MGEAFEEGFSGTPAPIISPVEVLVEMMATQKAAIELVQGLLDELYPGMRAKFGFNGIEVTGPWTQFQRFREDLEAFEAKKGLEP
jgi:hypothetical protein